MDNIRLSIIIPVYNSEEYLDRCLLSILSQDFTSYEIILVDDGSVDSSPLICDRYSSSDRRIRTVHKKNGGAGSARNAGLELAKGEYIMFVDSDDALLPYALDDMMEVVCGEDVVVGGCAVFADGLLLKDMRPSKTCSYKGSEYPKFFQENIARRGDLCDVSWAKLFRRKSIGEVRFYEDLNYAEDKLFVLAVLSAGSSVLTFSGAVYACHSRPDSLGNDICSDFHLMQLRRFLPRYADALGLLESRCPMIPQICSLYHRDLVGRYVCRALNIFAAMSTDLLTTDYLKWLYDLMDKDERLGIFSYRPGQILNMILYKIGNVKLAMSVYRATSSICRKFRRRK